MNMKKLFAEALGTGVLVFFAVGTAVALGGDDAAGKLGISIAFGLTIVAVAYGIGGISGAHLNPAVSLGAMTSGRMTTNEMLQYWGAQTVGGIVGAFLLFFIVGTGVAGYNEVNTGGGYSVFNALAFEIIATFIFVTVILGVTGENGNAAFAGLAIGLTLTLVHLVGIPIDGTSVNPARTIATNIFSGHIGELWIFIVGPLVGGALAGVVNKMGLTAQ